MSAATEKPPDPGNEKAALAGGSLETSGVNRKVALCTQRVKWKSHATFLWLEYRRTGDRRHLIAFRRHRAAMGGKLRRARA